MRGVAILVGVSAIGCYAPTVASGIACDPATPACPTGQSCLEVAGSYACTSEPEPGPDGGSSGDASGDSQTDSSGLCFGTGLVVDVCFPQPPSGSLIVTNGVVIDTASVGGSNCTMIVGQPSGPSLCVVARDMITIPVGTTLRATGPNPLVLIAGTTLDLSGQLDVSSHRGGTVGAGARVTCGIGVDGADAPSPPRAGGGGAGGSFAGAGANGGPGHNGPAGGVALAASNPTFVVGGCPGGAGGDGAGGGGGGMGGAGGGAVYLIAGSSIVVGGSVTASGAGGARGIGGLDSGGGGGGGGAGGMIAFDAPSLMITGMLHANGGGGGGGNGDQFDSAGQPGSDPAAALVPAPGGNGGAGDGGDGGDGFAQGNAAKAGINGGNPYAAGGGGGGGAGVIRVFQVAPGSISGMISPAPT